MRRLEERLSEAVRSYWEARARQARAQGRKSGRKDHGGRSAVTGGAQLDGFRDLIRELLEEAGLPGASVHTTKRDAVVPGFYRPTKEWDLLCVVDGRLLAAVEFKSQAGPSFGNNFNNRVEEAVGSAVDFHTAYREGAFRPGDKPWLGYLFLLEKANHSTSPVGVKEPHFEVLPEFRDSSYAKRYELLCLKLAGERLYDATCFLLSSKEEGLRGVYSEPCEEISFHNFIASLTGRAAAYAKLRNT